MKSIRAKIMLLLFGSVFIASFVIGSLGITLTRNVIEESSTENMNLLCRTNADRIDITFAKTEDSVDTLAHYAEASLSGVRDLKDESYRAKFSAEIEKNALHHIESIEGAVAIYLYYDPSLINTTDGFFYAKPAGVEEFVYHPLTVVSAYPEGDNEHVGWWFVPTARGEATWFEAYYNANLCRYVISYVVPIYKDGQLMGIVGADISAEHIAEYAKEVSLFRTGQAALLKSDGTVLYHPNFARGELLGEGDPGFEGVIEQLTAGDTVGQLISYQLKGVDKQLASCKLRNGMLMLCFAPVSEIYAKQDALFVANITITTVVLLFSLLIAFWVSRAFALPITKLNEAAKRLVDGEFEFDIASKSKDEIGELTRTFIETRKLLQQQIRLLDAEAHRDGLTGIGNKSAFMEKEAQLNQAIADGTADFSVAVLDVNKLKVANDVFGHMAGDKLLYTFAAHLTSHFDPSNIFRLGGDEFVVIIPEGDDSNSDEKLAACLAGMDALSVEGYPDCKVSCACGISRLNKPLDRQFSDVLRRADKEMYKNKMVTKKETFPWQNGAKGIKQIQIEKYCQLLQTLTESTDDLLFLMDMESASIRFFGGKNHQFNLADEQDLSANMHAFVHEDDHPLIKDALSSVLNREAESIDVDFRMPGANDTMQWANFRGNVIKDEAGSHFVFIGRITLNAFRPLSDPSDTLFNEAATIS